MRTCLICDDHALVRDALAATIRRRWPSAEILQAADFPTAWALAGRLPDLCLADLDMPGADARAGIAGILAVAPETRLLVITGLADDRLMLDLLAAGVAGFASKALDADIIAAAIGLVLAGGRYLPPRLAEMAAGGVIPPPPSTPGVRAAPAKDPLTPRQRDVLRLMADGLSNKDIARRLDLSPATVKTHVAHLIAIIGAANRTEASALARGRGLI